MTATTAGNFWQSEIQLGKTKRQSLSGAKKADVAIVGAGYTGLWTAYYLKTLEPALAVTLVEAEHVGFGASGRNGGWVIPGLSGQARLTAGLDFDQRQQCCDLLTANVDDIGAVLEKEGIDADFHKGGSVSAAARYPEQVAMQKEHLEEIYAEGYREDSAWWLDADALAERIRFNNGYGGVFQRDYAVVHPVKLVAGLAELMEKRGVTIYEQSLVRELEKGRVRTAEGTIDAPTVVVATEGYGRGLAPMRRHIMPVQSLIIATDPLPQELWDEIGMAGRPSFSDASRLVNYGQRTVDGRIVFGARGGYRYGGKSKRNQAIGSEEIELRMRLLGDLIPALQGVRACWGWGGSVGVSRRFCPHVIRNREQWLATAGGYTGEGVAASHLFARTLAELIVGVDSRRVEMPWVHDGVRFNQILKTWEPEPARWLGVNAVNSCFAWEESLLHGARSAPLRRTVFARLNARLAALMA